MKVLHISTHNENCGIGTYQANYISRMMENDSNPPEFDHIYFSHTPSKNRNLSKPEFANVISDLKKDLRNVDIVHIQHEFAFFTASQLEAIVKEIKSANKPLVATIHTAPNLRVTKRPLLSIKGPLARARNIVLNSQYLKEITPLARADKVIVHNNFTKKALLKEGFDQDRILLWLHPVYVIPEGVKDSNQVIIKKIRAKLDIQPGDVLIATFGYINITKGGLTIVDALSLLPKNYKLVMLGGIHPKAYNDEELNHIADHIYERKLLDRVYITGYLEDKPVCAALQSVDMVVYPYGIQYGSSSGAVNMGIANHCAIVATPVKAFVEMNEAHPVMKLADSFSYLDVARAIEQMANEDREEWIKKTVSYAEQHSFDVYGKKLMDLYKKLV